MRRLLWLGDAVLIVVGVIVLLSSKTVRDFATEHGVLFYVVSLALVAVLVVAVDWNVALRGERDSALARLPKITARDQALFDRIDTEMGRGTTATQYLESVFNGKSWQWVPMQPYLSFADDWGHDAMFDDPEMETALRRFHTTAQEFYGDAAVESHNPSHRNALDRYAELNSGSHRPEYSAEWKEVRERLVEKARATSAARDALYLLGRKRGY